MQTFTQVQDALEVDPFFAMIRANALIKAQGERMITAKMRSKLLTWLEKLSLNTFKFHRGTFITAAIILDQHLQRNDDPPSALQLLGCASLLIASKLAEEVIVAPECYSMASCNIFNKQQLLEKERTVYGGINWGKIRMGALRAIKIGCAKLGLSERLPKAEELLSMLLKQERTVEWKDSKLIYAVLALIKMDQEEELTNNEILALIEQF